MEKSTISASFQLMDSYISEFLLNVPNKIKNDKNFNLGINIGFKIVDINIKDLIGQIELRYDINITNETETESIGKITLVMNALFNTNEKISKNQFEQMLKINGASTLSHLCRAYINNATALSGMPTITLPLINFHEFFKTAVEQKSEDIKSNK